MRHREPVLFISGSIQYGRATESTGPVGRYVVRKTRKSIQIISVIIFVLLSLSTAHPVQKNPSPRPYYVAVAGDDGNDGSIERPWRTISHAVKHAGPSTRVIVADGTYNEDISIETGGEKGAPFELLSENVKGAIIDGEFKYENGIKISAPHVTIKGFEIRNFLCNGIYIEGPAAAYITVENNIIHHIASSLFEIGSMNSIGIFARAVSDCRIRQNTIYYVFGNNECFGILYDCRSSYKARIQNVYIEKNLIYLVDKAGIRVVDNTHPQSNRYIVLGNDMHVRENIITHTAYTGIDINYVNTYTENKKISTVTKIGRVLVENNFLGFCGNCGLNPKQSAYVSMQNNTICDNMKMGYHQSGEPGHDISVKYNLFTGNPVGSFIETEGENIIINNNYYNQSPPWVEFFQDLTKGWGTPHVSVSELSTSSRNRYEINGTVSYLSQVYMDPARGNYNYGKNSPVYYFSKKNIYYGIIPSYLTNVGASTRYNLNNIPVLPEINGMKITSFSSEDAKPAQIIDEYYTSKSKKINVNDISSGAASHLVDGVGFTGWRTSANATTGWVIINLPGNGDTAIGAFILQCSQPPFRNADARHPHRFRLFVKSFKENSWKEINTFKRYQKGAGRIFLINSDPTSGPIKAKQIKLEILSNHGGPYLEVSEFRLFEAFDPFQ